MKFRDLKPNEIDIRVATASEKGCSLLLYKDSRVDMAILDETVGCLNWKREHTRENANCIVSIWDSEKQQWVGKEDTGKESFSDKEKGLASDSFKRACFNWGIGRELYTSPFIWIKGNTKLNHKQKWVNSIDFEISSLEILDKEIVALEICEKNKRNNVLFRYKKGVSQYSEVPKEAPKKTETPKANKPTVDKTDMEKAISSITKLVGSDIEKLEKQLTYHKINSLSEATIEQLRQIHSYFKGGAKK